MSPEASLWFFRDDNSYAEISGHRYSCVGALRGSLGSFSVYSHWFDDFLWRYEKIGVVGSRREAAEVMDSHAQGLPGATENVLWNPRNAGISCKKFPRGGQ